MQSSLRQVKQALICSQVCLHGQGCLARSGVFEEHWAYNASGNWADEGVCVWVGGQFTGILLCSTRRGSDITGVLLPLTDDDEEEEIGLLARGISCHLM